MAAAQSVNGLACFGLAAFWKLLGRKAGDQVNKPASLGAAKSVSGLACLLSTGDASSFWSEIEKGEQVNRLASLAAAQSFNGLACLLSR